MPDFGSLAIAHGETPLTSDGDDLAEQVRPGTVADVPAIARLIETNLEIGHLLPRSREDLTAHAHRFLVITRRADAGADPADGGATAEGRPGAAEQIIGCAELAPLSRAVAEVRSLVIDDGHRGRGLGSRLVEELKRAARRDGFSTLCAFTHQASVFIRLGFSIVPHPWLPEKLSTDCYACPKFRACGQYAVALPLRGGSLRRTPPAGQRPYQSMPPGLALRLVHPSATAAPETDAGR